MSSPTETVNVASANPATIAADIPTEEEGYRVHVGNLSFKATEEEVREHLQKAGGEILSVTIPMKFKRPSGFAFVSYKTEADANKAVEELNDTDIGDRKITLAIARSRAEQAERREAHLAQRQAGKEEREAKAGSKGEGETSGVTNGEGESKKKRSSKRVPRRRQPGEDVEEVAEVNGEALDGAAVKKSGRKPRKPREERIDEEGEPRRERKSRMQLTDEQSPNTIFVANLPFDVDDDSLASIFTNLSIGVKTAKVVQGLRQGRGGRRFYASRGFGFVEIEDASQQNEAVEKVQGSLIGERQITAKIANEMKPIEGTDAGDGADAAEVEKVVEAA